MRVAEIMSRQPVTCAPEDSGAQAARLLWDHDCGALPVVTGDHHRVVGMITDRDLCMAALLQGRRLADIEVASAMSRTVWACHPEDLALPVARLMAVHRVRRVPVVNWADELMGLVSVGDLARVALRGLGDLDTAELARLVAALTGTTGDEVAARRLRDPTWYWSGRARAW